LSALEQSGEQLARQVESLSERQPVNALVKQHEHQLKLEKQRTRYQARRLVPPMMDVRMRLSKALIWCT
jgi:hypothetical protein